MKYKKITHTAINRANLLRYMSGSIIFFVVISAPLMSFDIITNVMFRIIQWLFGIDPVHFILPVLHSQTSREKKIEEKICVRNFHPNDFFVPLFCWFCTVCVCNFGSVVKYWYQNIIISAIFAILWHFIDDLFHEYFFRWRTLFLPRSNLSIRLFS